MKVLTPLLFGTGHFLPECEVFAGGAELGICLNAAEWVRQGVDVNLMCYHPTRRGRLVVDGITLWFIPGQVQRTGSGQKATAIYSNVWRILSEVRPDLFYQTGAGVTTGLFHLMCRLRRIPMILRLANDRDVSPQLRVSLGGWRYQVFLLGLRGAAARIAQTRLQQRILQRDFGLEATLVPNCKAACPVIQAPVRDTISWVARAMPAKRPHLFLDLVRGHPEQHFTMVAPGHTDAAEEEKLAVRAATLPNLEYIRKLNLEQVQELFARSRLLVSTSCFEGFPNTFLEASLQETPILSLEIDPDEYLTRHRAGRVCQKAEDLGPELRRLLADESQLRELGRNGRQAVLQEYEVGQVALRYLEVFRRVLGR